MIVYKRRYRRKLYGKGIFNTIGRLFGKVASSEAAKKIAGVASKVASNEAVKKAASEAGKKVAAKVGTVAGEKIVQGIDKLTNKKVNPQLTVESTQTLQRLTTPQRNESKSIANILEGAGQAIAIDKLARRLNGLL